MIRKTALFSESMQDLFQLHTHKNSQKFCLSYCTSCSVTGSPRNQLPPLPTRPLLHPPLPTLPLSARGLSSANTSEQAQQALASQSASQHQLKKEKKAHLYHTPGTESQTVLYKFCKECLYTDMTFFISLPLETLQEGLVLCRGRGGRRKGSDNCQREHIAFYPQGSATNSLVSDKSYGENRAGILHRHLQSQVELQKVLILKLVCRILSQPQGALLL